MFKTLRKYCWLSIVQGLMKTVANLSCWCPRPGRWKCLNSVLCNLEVDGFTWLLFTFNYTPLTNIMAKKNPTDFSGNKGNLYKSPERCILSSLDYMGEYRRTRSARFLAHWLCTPVAQKPCSQLCYIDSWVGLAVLYRYLSRAGCTI